ncbi:hypothetical protein C8R43DRAFT_903080 [Mycena crocata]|nr:hypothetical protein C8R43DRAFT_903080 [Mycena crocata]
MHIIANILPTLVALWTGTFKDMTDSDEDYILDADDWTQIGEECAKAGDTIPAAFGSRIPNVATERNKFKTENWFAFLMFLGPALLHGRLKTVYYRHFIKLVNIFTLCLKYFLPNEEIELLENGVVEWVEEYERLYYRYRPERISACTLPIHALLHIPANIRTMGPLWAYWNFPTERFCGSIVLAIQSRKHPFTSMAHRLRDIAQINQLKLIYGLADELDLSDSRETEKTGFALEDYPDFVFIYPQDRTHALEQSTKKRISTFLSTNYAPANVQAADLIKFVPDLVHAFGKIKFVGGGDMCHSVFAYRNPDTTRRDASFVKYCLQVDANKHRRRAPVQMQDAAFYGQVQFYFILDLPDDFPFAKSHRRPGRCQGRRLALALMSPTKLEHSGRMPAYKQFAPAEVVTIDAILGLIGRVYTNGKRRWMLLGRPEVMEQVDGATFSA